MNNNFNFTTSVISRDLDSKCSGFWYFGSLVSISIQDKEKKFYEIFQFFSIKSKKLDIAIIIYRFLSLAMFINCMNFLSDNHAILIWSSRTQWSLSNTWNILDYRLFSDLGVVLGIPIRTALKTQGNLNTAISSANNLVTSKLGLITLLAISFFLCFLFLFLFFSFLQNIFI